MGAAVLFMVEPTLAQTSPRPASAERAQVGEHGDASDFDNDVKQGRDELKKDPAAQRRQKEVVDGEDEMAGEGDGQNDRQNVDEYGDLHDAENIQGKNEDAKDIHNSGIDEVDDADNLDEVTQEVIDEHQAQEEGDSQRGGNETSGEAAPAQEGSSSSE